jgi:hypothetical protein
MNRLLVGPVLAALALPALAASVAAAPTTPYRAYYGRLACTTGSYSVERGKDFILVRNPTNRAVPQGARIELRIYVKTSRYRLAQRRIVTAWKTLGKGTDTITFVQPDGAYACSARVLYR